MSNVLIDEDLLKNLCDFAREKSGIDEKMKPAIALNRLNEIPVQGELVIVPGRTPQEIKPNQYLSGAITIEGDSDLIAENIAENISIFGVTGTYKGTSQPQYFGVMWTELNSRKLPTKIKIVAQDNSSLSLDCICNQESIYNGLYHSVIEIDISDPNIVSIGRYAFTHFNSLREIIFNETIKDIGSYSLMGANSLYNIVFPPSVETIGAHIFRTRNTPLGTCYIGSNIISISTSAFVDCGDVAFTIDMPRDSISGFPWGAGQNSTVEWIG